MNSLTSARQIRVDQFDGSRNSFDGQPLQQSSGRMAEDIIRVRCLSDQRCLRGMQIRLHFPPCRIALFCVRTGSQINRRLIRKLPKVPVPRA